MLAKNSYTFTIKEGVLDCNSRPAFAFLCDFILLSAGFDADKNGCGIISINQQDHSWVLSRLAIEWYKLPLCGEQISIQTWVCDVNKLMTTRNFAIYSEREELIGEAITSWAMIDTKTRHAVDLREQLEYTKLIIPEPSNIAAARKLPAISAPESESLHTVSYSDLDFNNHTTTRRYIEWMFNLLPIEKLRVGFASRFEIHFIQESRYGQSLSVKMQQCEQKYCFEISNSDGASICRASVIL